eukprot:TRINITY_DN94140_c0_g1_i1.p1 TRINITY_DN94140_c0_g1~~TRINITY_DN94140_c0_g1_i1.p1  ORF type:complete len:127 (+),score=9.62 TRINITY_DN94140_c0_g1_i1:55-381(+)
MARVVSFAAGLGLTGLAYYNCREAVWTRAKVARSSISGIQHDVPSMKNFPEPIEVPDMFPSVHEVVETVKDADYVGHATKMWNSGLLAARSFVATHLLKDDSADDDSD